MSEADRTNVAAGVAGAAAGRGVRAEEVAMVCHGDEVYGVGSVMKVYAEHMPGALFLCMREGAMAEWLRVRGKRVMVPGGAGGGGERLSFVPGGPGGAILRMPAVMREARRAAKRIGPMLEREGIRIFHGHWLSHYLIGSGVRERGIRNVWHVHNSTSRKRMLGLGIKLNHLLAWRHADAIIAVSGFVAENWRGCGRPVSVVYNAVGIPAEGEVVWPRESGRIRLGMAGRMDPMKGLDLLIDAAGIAAGQSGVHDFEVEVRGFSDAAPHEDFAREMRGKIARAGLEGRFRLEGYTAEMGAFYRGVDVVVAPSRVTETFGLTAAEGLAQGKGVIVAGHGGLAEVVRHEREGLQFRPGDAGSLAEQMMRMFEPGLRGRLARAGRASAAERFSPEVHVKAVMGVYAGVLAGNDEI